jgi:hypothetical protein
MENMKRMTLVLVLALNLFVLKIHGQGREYKADSRLITCLGKEAVQELAESKSDLLLYYNYILNHSYYTTPLNLEKAVTGTDIRQVSIKAEFNGKAPATFSEQAFDPATFNPMLYDFAPELNSFKTYVWKSAGIAIIFKPISHVEAEFKEWMKK